MECLFVGAGAIAAEYAEAIPDSSLRVTGVCDLRAERAAAVAETVDARAYTDVEAMLASEDAPLVCVLTDHRSHAQLTRTALAADRHVFSQKPLAMDADEATALLELATDRGLAVGCAPISPENPAQRRVAALLADGRLGPVRLGYAHAHVGRVTRWHDRPESFLAVGPLYDGAVYPLTNLVAWFGRIERVRAADALDPWPAGQPAPERPSHVEATLQFARGPVVRLTASFYAPHRSREFTTLELHGDDGSVYLADAGTLEDSPDVVRYGRLGSAYSPVPPARPERPARLLDGPAELAAAIERGERPHRSGWRGAHVVRVCNAVEQAASDGGPVAVAGDDWASPASRPSQPEGSSVVPDWADEALGLPRVGVTATTAAAVARALDGGCRLIRFGTAASEAVTDAIRARGAPGRAAVHLSGRVEPDERPADLLARTPFDRLDSLLIAGDERRESRVEAARAAGVADAVGIELSDSTAATAIDATLAATDPAMLACDTGPERPRETVIEACRSAGVRVLATGRPADHATTEELRRLAVDRDVAAVHAWNAARGVIPTPPVEQSDVAAVLRAASLAGGVQ